MTEGTSLFMLAADAILLLHVLVVIFIVFGLVLIFLGNTLKWSWIRNPWFRLLHLAAIGTVVILSWLNFICPLTSIEMELRTRAGEMAYTGSFISHWLEAILYYHAPPWVFIVAYTIFGLMVILSWFLIHPRHFPKK